MKLNLGCGRRRLEGDGWVNVDMFSHPNVDVVHDLNVFPYPFDDGCADYIFINHVLEHLVNPYDVMLECHRLLKAGGVVEVVVPHKNSLSAFDIAHRCFFTERSMCHLLDAGKDVGVGVHGVDGFSGSSLQCHGLFKLLLCRVKRLIPTPWGYLPGFNVYKNAVGIGIRTEICWKLKKN